MQRLVAKELVKKDEKKMTTNSHSRGSGKATVEKEDAKVNGKKMNQEEVEMEQGEFLGDSEDEDLKTETSSKDKGAHGFKSHNLCMFAGERQLADIVIKKESNQNVDAEKEGPAEDWSRVVERINGYVKFPKSTPNEVIELYRKLDLQRRELERQRTHAQVNLLRKQDREVFMKDIHEAEDGKKARLADSLMVNTNQHAEIFPKKAEEKASEKFLGPRKDLKLQREKLVTESTSKTSGSCDFNANNLIVFAGDEPKHVAEGREAWEVATSMAAATATSMVATELTEIWNNSGKMDIEIEEVWQLMMRQSKWRKIEMAASKINQNSKLIDRKKKMEGRTTEMQRQQRNKAFGRLHNKVWDPGRKEQGLKRMIRRS